MDKLTIKCRSCGEQTHVVISARAPIFDHEAAEWVAAHACANPSLLYSDGERVSRTSTLADIRKAARRHKRRQLF